MSGPNTAAAVHCRRQGCGQTWPRDPALEVICPTCRAPIGRACARPSEHRTWGGEPHAERDIAADRAGRYGPCPLGWCGLDNKRRRQEAAAMPLFAAADMPRMDEPPPEFTPSSAGRD